MRDDEIENEIIIMPLTETSTDIIHITIIRVSPLMIIHQAVNTTGITSHIRGPDLGHAMRII